MIPLAITARTQGPIHLGAFGGIALDALLAEVAWRMSGDPPATCPDEVTRYEIPVQLEPGGRFHLASMSVGAYERMERRHIVRRFPIERAQCVGREINRVSMGSGPHRDYRFPLEAGHLADDQLRWWAIGDAEAIRGMLAFVTHLGRRRAVGLGAVREWIVDPCEPWDGFPVLAPNGAALRHLPLDWPGLGAHAPRMGRLTYPYHHLSREREETVAAPCASFP